jgi:hypothetical protein
MKPQTQFRPLRDKRHGEGHQVEERAANIETPANRSGGNFSDRSQNLGTTLTDRAADCREVSGECEQSVAFARFRGIPGDGVRKQLCGGVERRSALATARNNLSDHRRRICRQAGEMPATFSQRRLVVADLMETAGDA